jgi:subfamily B ATP-binding cassette protein HlyB/CyaB
MTITRSRSQAAASGVSVDTGLACLFRLGVQNGVYAEVSAVKRRNLIEGERLTVARLIALAGEFGLSARRAHFEWRGLTTTPFDHPILLLLDNGNVITLMGVRRGGAEEVAVSDPLYRDGEVFFLSRVDLERAWSGSVVVLEPLPPDTDDGGFGFSWFTKKLFAERRLMRDIVAAALTMNLIALSVPIFFQLLVDKVVPNQAFATLYTITAGVFLLILFDGAFNYLRNYLLAFITRKLDHTVTTDTIDHLLKLPIHYFHANPSGVIAYKLQEANNVREFLASRLFNTFLDFIGIVIFLPVLLIYSWQLTLIVLAVAGVAFVTLAVMSREFRLKLRDVNDIIRQSSQATSARSA